MIVGKDRHTEGAGAERDQGSHSGRPNNGSLKVYNI
jgi:hypothetical protein